jgi:hypothetical protein
MIKTMKKFMEQMAHGKPCGRSFLATTRTKLIIHRVIAIPTEFLHLIK